MKNKLLIFILLFSCYSGFSQEEDPTIGLVLSGGGAKGLAHIGALKVIEDAGIQIDIIGGSSMGAIIGSLYAAGYSAEQLDSIFHETNFSILIQDELPRNAKTYYEKQEAGKYALKLPFDHFNISFPMSLSRGQNLYNLMSRLLLHVEPKGDFSELPIPFFAVATDLETGEEVILDSGYLPKAVSASAAIPTLFSPVKINGRILTDGGVSNNYPVEELRKRGADIIIGVDVQDTLAGRDQLQSVFDVLTQISNFRTIEDMREKIEKTDVYINPDIGNFSVISFDKGSKIIASGEKAARKKWEELRRIAALQETEARPEAVIPEIDSLYIANVRITGDHSYPRAYIMGKLRLQYPDTISYRDFNAGINNLAATGNFSKIDYKLLSLNKGYVLELQLREDPNKTFLKFGVHYDNLYKTGVLLNYTKKSLLFTNDVTSLDVVLGDNFRYNFEYYLDKGYYWSIGLKSRFNEFDKDVGADFASGKLDISAVDINQIAVEYSDFTNQFYIQTLVLQQFLFGLGAEHKYLEVISETIGENEEQLIPSTIFDKSHYYSTYGYLKLDTYDDKYFPQNGFFFSGDFHFYFLSSDYNQNFSEFSIAKGKLGYVFSPLPHLTARLSSGAGFQIGNNKNNSLHFFLGGYGNDFINNILPFYGYDFLEISGDSFIKGMVELDYEFLEKNHFLISANFANVENNLYSTGNWLSSPHYSGYALGYGLETFLGPIDVKYSYSPETENSIWFFSLGFWF